MLLLCLFKMVNLADNNNIDSDRKTEMYFIRVPLKSESSVK